MSAAAQRYYLGIDELATARGADATLSFDGVSAARFGEVLQHALRSDELFERWRALQPEPDEVDPALGATDAAATVSGEQHDLGIRLVATTVLPGEILRQRLRLLAGQRWEMRDVTRA